ncbi:uncharacterized protein LOC117651885 [Thrips palmi]|uniref:Uncharacterized protein LOC117651885 n=1 Tax=Thrips palmi TaxID=161013 RepID=A0A6P9A543_THRPL|nr:uncharacterized protein LOC117651885 [Thrips palmi]
MAARAGGSSNGDKWWTCSTCLKKSPCPAHSVQIRSSAELQKQLKAAQANLRKAQAAVDACKDACQRAKDGVVSSSPTLTVKHSGWMDDDLRGWEPGRVSVLLALDGSSLSPALGASLRQALKGVSLQFKSDCSCPFSFFYADGVEIPLDVVALLPDRPGGAGREGLRPGAVLVHPARRRLEVYTRNCKPSEGKQTKLLGFLLEASLTALSYKHTPNKRNSKDCTFCHYGHYVSIDFEKVELQGVAGVEDKCEQDSKRAKLSTSSSEESESDDDDE